MGSSCACPSDMITPYLNLDYVHAKLDSFTENDGNGAGLTVTGGRVNATFLTGGVKWATQMGGVVPEVNLGYQDLHAGKNIRGIIVHDH